MASIYLALGTNLGDRPANLKLAVESLPNAVWVTGLSPVYETAPWGFLEQPRFLNQALKAETGLEPEALLVYLKKTEIGMGRLPSFTNGPRLIDIDLLFYGDLVYQSPNLTIPHPRLAERGFVLAPLADLAPDLLHPVLGKTIRELWAASEKGGIAHYPEPPK